MQPLMKITEEQEAEFKVMTTAMYKHGGMANVLACVSTMQKVQIIILKKLNELIEAEKNGDEGSYGGTI